MAVDNKQIAEDVLVAVGGKENITSVMHCMTRLRLVLKDINLPNQEEVKKIPGVLGAQISGGQFQVIIGQNVSKVYKEVCDMTGLQRQKAVEENLDAPKEKLTWKKVGSNILDFLSGSMVPLIPAMVVASLFKTLSVVLGPDTMNIITVESGLYVLCDFLYDACFYFLPIYLGFNAAKKLNIPPVLGAFVGAALISPDFMTLVANGQTLNILGLNVPMNNYSQSVFPVLLSVFALSVIYKYVNKIMPEALSFVLTPFVSMLILVPIEFCLLAPLGNQLGGIVASFLVMLAENLGFIGLGIIGAAWMFCVVTGMHVVVYMAILPAAMAVGYDMIAMPAITFSTIAVWGMCVGAMLRLKDKEQKSLCLSYLISAVVGGVPEPALYGIAFRYKKPFIAIAVGGFAGGLVGGLLQVVAYLGGGAANFMVFLPYLQGGAGNLVKCLIASAVAAVVTAVVTYMFGFDKRDLEATE